MGKYIRAIIISVTIGVIVGYASYQVAFSNIDFSTLSFNSIFLGVIKKLLGYCFIPYLVALGIGGYRIEKLRQEGEEVVDCSRSHALIVNGVFWPSYILIYYVSGLSAFGNVIGWGIPMIGIVLGILLFSISISRFTAYLIFNFDKNDGFKIRFGE
jgi:hypothetical protein